MIVLSSPSGAGKTSIAKQLLTDDPTLKLSVSMTTRPKRSNETEGVDYFFVTQDFFKQKIKEGEFLEYATVFDHYYGTPKSSVDALLNAGYDVLFDVDWQGTQQLCAHGQDHLITLFILPPSLEILRQRLMNRSTDAIDVIERRMRDALDDISHFAEYDYVIINENLNASIDSVKTIITAERLKRHRQVGLIDFINTMKDTQNR